MQNLDAFERQFPTDEACKDYLVVKRWPAGVRCARCGAQEKVYALKARPYHWVCKNADCGGRNGYRFSVLTGTIFQDTKIGLRLWFKVGYFMLIGKKGISSLQVHRVIFGENSGSDWRTSWYMCMRWRAAMKGNMWPLGGVVEVDETHIGDKDRNRHWKNKSAQKRATAGHRKAWDKVGYGKTTVIGAIERKGNVVARIVGDMDAPTLSAFVQHAVSEKVDLVATDEKKDYRFVRAGMSRHAT